MSTACLAKKKLEFSAILLSKCAIYADDKALPPFSLLKFKKEEQFIAWNTVISLNFMLWKFCGNAKFPKSFGRISSETLRKLCVSKNLNNRKFGKITVFYAVIQGDILGYISNINSGGKLSFIWANAFSNYHLFFFWYKFFRVWWHILRIKFLRIWNMNRLFLYLQLTIKISFLYLYIHKIYKD